MNQPDLFNWKPPDRAFARATDPLTSKVAAAEVTARLPDLESQVFNVVRGAGSRGANLDEVCTVTGLDKVTASPRFKPLERKTLIRRAPFTRAGKAGKQQTVWVMV